MISLMLVVLISQNSPAKDVNQTQQEIRIINLVNGLELNDYQMEFILEKAREVEDLRQEYKQRFQTYEQDLLNVFEDLKTNQMNNANVSDDLRKDVFGAEATIHDGREEMRASVDRIAKEVEAVLEPNQTYQLEKYVACLVPPPGSESRIGQSENPIGLTQQLTRIRQIPNQAYETKKYVLCDKVIDKMKKRMPPGFIFNESAERQRILGLLDEMRALSDIDFTLQQAEYVEKIKGDYFIKDEPVDNTAKIREFLLNPLIIPILDQKLASQ